MESKKAMETKIIFIMKELEQIRNKLNYSEILLNKLLEIVIKSD